MNKVHISPSILSANQESLKEDIFDIKMAGAEYLHFDVMDGKFVNNKTFDEKLLKEIFNYKTNLILDVHLMVVDPLNYVEKYIDCGADIITVHYEAIKEDELLNIINLVHKLNKKIGLSIKPNTDVKLIEKYLSLIDLVLVMSVEPGFGGQKFLESSISKIKYLNEYRIKNKLKYLIEVDGGINDETSKKVINSGADILVSGSYIFKSLDRKKAIASLRGK